RRPVGIAHPRARPVVLAARPVVGERPDLGLGIGGYFETVIGAPARLIPGAVAYQSDGDLNQFGGLGDDRGDGGGDPVGVASEEDLGAFGEPKPELGAVAGDARACWTGAHRWRSFRERSRRRGGTV